MINIFLSRHISYNNYFILKQVEITNLLRCFTNKKRVHTNPILYFGNVQLPRVLTTSNEHN